ncbi:MAG: tRNA (N6-isopentenyl adenosine(37)-C2)-methylthiotransferase MiaB [Spirochaetia bacterium]|nr:tRNA (N6-isopentenyl adenosine(37)-C2)-methylthiotransferase MiaB [Spirochaetia bacterium]
METGATKERLYVETYGCQMNTYDSGLVEKILSDRFATVGNPEDADLILLNTCAIREKAHEKVYGRLGSFRDLKKRNPGLVIGVLGCMAQNLGDDLFAMGLPVDILAGPDNYRSLPGLVDAVRESGHHKILTRLSLDETYAEIQPGVVQGCLAYVTIMRGCDNFCSFCVVPYTRGRERSRDQRSIIDEIKQLVDEEGVKEVMLLGQNVNSYKSNGGDFAGLVEEILKHTNVMRLRFTSPHPHDFPEHLLRLMAAERRFASQVHLPLQSGSTSVLERMKRDYTREEFLDLVYRIRSIVPGVGLTSDVIVGFSGETEEEFQDTLTAVEQSRFLMAYMFGYSEREQTLAQKKFPDNVPEAVKSERLGRLITVQREGAAKANLEEVGRVHQVLVEGYSKRSEADFAGRTDSGKVVVFPVDSRTEPGELASIRITASSSATLRGELV